MSSARYFEDVQIGDKWTTWGRTVFDADIVLWSGLAGYFDPIHTDEEFSKKTAFGGRIAPGHLILTITDGLLGMVKRYEGLAFLGMNNVRFTKAVRPGDTIHIEAEVIAKRESKKADRGIVTLKTTVKNQHGEAVVELEIVDLVARRPQA